MIRRHHPLRSYLALGVEILALVLMSFDFDRADRPVRNVRTSASRNPIVECCNSTKSVGRAANEHALDDGSPDDDELAFSGAASGRREHRQLSPVAAIGQPAEPLRGPAVTSSLLASPRHVLRLDSAFRLRSAGRAPPLV